MPTATKPPSTTIPQRADIDPRHTWNLADLFTDDKAWEAAFKKAQSLTEKVRAHMGKLATCLPSTSKALASILAAITAPCPPRPWNLISFTVT